MKYHAYSLELLCFLLKTEILIAGKHVEPPNSSPLQVECKSTCQIFGQILKQLSLHLPDAIPRFIIQRKEGRHTKWTYFTIPCIQNTRKQQQKIMYNDKVWINLWLRAKGGCTSENAGYIYSLYWLVQWFHGRTHLSERTNCTS